MIASKLVCSSWKGLWKFSSLTHAVERLLESCLEKFSHVSLFTDEQKKVVVHLLRLKDVVTILPTGSWKVWHINLTQRQKKYKWCECSCSHYIVSHSRKASEKDKIIVTIEEMGFLPSFCQQNIRYFYRLKKRNTSLSSVKNKYSLISDPRLV